MPRPNLVEGQLLRNLGEQILHVLGSLGRSLKEEKASLLCIGRGIGCLNRTLIGLLLDEIQLVTGKGDNDILVCLALKFLDPRLGLVQRCLEGGYVSSCRPLETRTRDSTYRLCNIVNNYRAVGIPVVHGR